ncbi:hypothetical protein BC659_0612 [Sediminibacterium goheungense]|uniref:TonB-dependent receptor-like protein n=2 Tax=Sediminibacterium goheungense TaxID=1086393 RepID=A0A4R6J2Q3_9BACT|nr:hypothetical protein BC659_0612 [Sediminibacterium goheungense]
MTVFPAKMIDGSMIFYCGFYFERNMFMRYFIILSVTGFIFPGLRAAPVITDTIPSAYDSSLIQLLLSQESAESNAILMNEMDGTTTAVTFSPLYGEKDVFLQMAAFQFSAMRYRYRGYDAALSGAMINGLVFNDLQRGNPAWALWSGQTQWMRNNIDFTANRFQDNWLGNIGITSSTDMRVAAQRKQLQWGYGISNRTYTQRYHFSYAAETNRHGISWAIAANMRMAAEGYQTACEYQSAAYYIGIDKQFQKAGLLSFILFGSPQLYGKQAAVTAPVTALLGINYNPNWGYQGTMKRNAAIGSQHMPVAILSFEWNPDNASAWITSLGFVGGKRGDTGLDWYNAADPRPDYYRYQPAYQTDSILQWQVTDALLGDKNQQQVNWQQLYHINKNAWETIHGINGTNESETGNRAHYLLEQRMIETRRWLLSSHYRARINTQLHIATGFHFSYQRNRHYKTVYDLLGADFHVNWNQFAENDFPSDQQAIQFDIETPNRILRKGDRYGYDYLATIVNSDCWVQAEYVTKRIDYLLGFRFSKTTYNRTGFIRNGLFPLDSKGRSITQHFLNPLLKAGFTYKFHHKHMLLALFQLQSRAPFFDDVYIAPRMRNTIQENPLSEKMIHVEASYRLMLNKVKARISTYYTRTRDGMNVLTFYHDGYRNFVNYAIRHINRQFAGVEAAVLWEPGERWELTLSLAKEMHIYTSRQAVRVSLDNNDALLDRMEVYSKGFRIGGSPQQVAGTGIRYRTPNGFFIQLNAVLFDDLWIDINPLRRTYEALEGVPRGSEQWYKIIGQTKLPSVVLTNMFLGKGFSIRNVYNKKPLRFFCSAAVNNLTNQTNIITGGYEQLRFDQETKDPDRFPPKLFYGYGLNYTLSLSISF